MDIFGEIADERRAMADLLASLTDEQLAVQSLCTDWNVHEVAAHLIVPLEVGLPRFMLTILLNRGSFDRANSRLAHAQARRPVVEIIEVLRRRADSHFTPPGAGPEAPLTDVLVHGLDIRWPLGLTRPLQHERLQTSLTFLAHPASKSNATRGGFTGLRLEAPDVDWTHGEGPTVRGEAEALLLAMTGRTVALDHLEGDGVGVLRAHYGRPKRR